ncbi:two component, sigma54 specific, transcriptional regulator, Fis family (plasmid) [Sulfuricella denitrificans skB26]|uniref:Two component, sigma54 specific, transcriptional regulator, Fis family n=1 Tax=Sulfuricella denitrificans (strain DSM 22764 / NBRC 105220 / skB26) TaxID=1163617 RepID=S6APP9_SULDS|nr:sigma-54 dependent transcriptional regulator [Sulfuricella denitrificans]BAN36919.1 two component, sigma54 specific, transcriptional regulator, Fis family [Sulfuricella denitrificans skB26]
MSTPPARICLIEDDEIMGESLMERFEMEGYACDWFRTGQEARLTLANKHYQVAISDIRLPDISGQVLFEELLADGMALPPFIFITGFGAIDDAVRLLKLGAEDYLTKPFQVNTLLDKVRNLCQRDQTLPGEAFVLGISSAMREIEAMLARVAASSGTVLITGESGVGKEKVARALHDLRDPQGKRPFIAVNCGALTESLLEAELFGHEKGAFTGANREKKGYFEQAHSGTLFLDEIGDMPLAMQVKLLRAIQERAIVRVGGEKPIPVEIRLICATHQDLIKMVKLGEFREDLYYRIHVIHIPVPPLRERLEDILWLADRFLDEFAAESGVQHSFHPAATQALVTFSWPGNVRELRNCIERACILSANPVLTTKDLFDQTLSSNEQEEATVGSLTHHLRTTERHYIEQALTAHQWRIKETATAIGITRKNLWEKMRKLDISAPEENM